MKRFRKVIVVLVSFLFATAAMAEPNPTEIVEKATQAAANLQAISYSASFQGEGDLISLAPKIDANVVARRGANGGNHFIAMEGTITNPGGNASEPFKFACDDKQFYDLNPTKKTLTIADLATTPIMRYRASPVFPSRYLDNTPYKTELSNASLAYLGTEDVDGVQCNVVEVGYANGRLGRSFLYIGKDDYLLRKLVRELSLGGRPNQPKRTGRLMLSIKNLNTQPAIAEGAFKLAAPADFSTSRAKPAERRSGLLELGSTAPDFELPRADGTMVSLKSLRGKFVVLDFWATWCGPCKKAMPELQKLHDHFKDAPVAVFGVNCRERSADPMAYIKSRGFTYPQLLKGDSAANDYKVQGIPCVYVLDPEGKVCFTFAGYHPQMETTLVQIIESGIEKAKHSGQAARGPDAQSTDKN